MQIPLSCSQPATAKQHDPTQSIPNTLEKVKGYKSLTIYKMTASPYYYVRIYEDGKVIRRSTKKEDRRDAIKFAEEFFVEIKTKKLNKQPLTKKSGFEVFVWSLFEENKAKVKRGELAEGKISQDEGRLGNDLLPFFRRYEVADINYKAIVEYIQTLNTDNRNLSSSSLKTHLSHIKTILRHAQRMDVINSLPAIHQLKGIQATSCQCLKQLKYIRQLLKGNRRKGTANPMIVFLYQSTLSREAMRYRYYTDSLIIFCILYSGPGFTDNSLRWFSKIGTVKNERSEDQEIPQSGAQGEGCA